MKFTPITNKAKIAPTKGSKKRVYLYVSSLISKFFVGTGIIEKYDKANELITQVLKTNIDFYANDSYLANKKVNRLIKAGMPEHATEILIELLKRLITSYDKRW